MTVQRKGWQPRGVIKHFNISVHTWTDADGMQRIIASEVLGPGGDRICRSRRYLTIQDAEYLIGQLQRAIKRAPRAR